MRLCFEADADCGVLRHVVLQCMHACAYVVIWEFRVRLYAVVVSAAVCAFWARHLLQRSKLFFGVCYIAVRIVSLQGYGQAGQCSLCSAT
jgi:hypothetical protein